MFNRQRIQGDSPYLRDESSLTGRAGSVILPYDENELREAIRYANSKGIKVTVRGMGTGVCGGAVPQGGDVLSMEHMSGVTGVGRDDEGYFLRVLPCTTIQEINDLLMSRSFDGLEDVTEGAVSALASEPVPYLYPVDPTEMGGSIGGNIATNASGPRTLRYGPTRDWVRGLRVVLPDGNYIAMTRGEHVADGRRISFPAGRNYYSFELPRYDSRTGVKNATGPVISEGMDLVDLFIGSEGVFGVVTEADIRLVPWYGTVSCILFLPSDADALAVIREMRSDDLVDPEFLEYMDHGSLDLLRGVMEADPALLPVPTLPADAGAAVFTDLADTGDMDARFRRLGEILSRHGGSLDATWCGHEASDRSRMRSLRHAIPRSVFEYVASLKSEMPRIHKMGTDMSVPDDACDEMMSFYASELDAAGLEYVVFGHMGDNHPHVEIILRSMEDFERASEVYARFAAKAVELGGSPSAEHGIGKIKTGYIGLMYGEDAVADLRRIKSVLDPNGVLCPGNMIGE